MTRLKIIDSYDSPIAEASGLCTAVLGGAECLVVVGDADNTIAWTPLVDDAPSEWSELDLSGLDGVPEDLGQFEAVADAGAGRLLILGEEPALVVLVDPIAGECVGWWRITMAESPDFADLWDREENSRGEGLIPLAAGHVLVIKEKSPVVAIDCGAGGRRSWDDEPDDAPWEAPDGHELPVAHWSNVENAPRDLSDCVRVEGRLVALSDRDSCLVELAHDDESFAAGEPVALDKKIEKPEGLAVSTSGAWFVAMDSRRTRGSLVRIQPPGN
jgi:hypothetical protein